MPGSGGSYVYLREGYGRETYGRMMGFLFIWQFILSGPLEIASGYLGFTQYLGYIWKDMSRFQYLAVIIGLGLLNIALLYRKITFIGKLTVSLWVGTILTTFVVIITGAFHFNSGLAFDFPPGPSIFRSVFSSASALLHELGFSITSATTTFVISVTKFENPVVPFHAQSSLVSLRWRLFTSLSIFR